MGCMELSSSSCAEIGVPIDLRRVSQLITVVSKRKSSHLSCMMGNRECSGANEGKLGLISS